MSTPPRNLAIVYADEFCDGLGGKLEALNNRPPVARNDVSGKEGTGAVDLTGGRGIPALRVRRGHRSGVALGDVLNVFAPK
jgi:hypothetical protein